MKRRIIDAFWLLAASERADIVVFPELALTGRSAADVQSATVRGIARALQKIQDAAKTNRIYVIVGAPLWVDGVWQNGAVVIGDDGAVLTRYAEIASNRPDLFASGRSAKAMWFRLKGVHAIVTIGEDARWVEIDDLAATRGMSLHFHLGSEADASAEAVLFRKQRYVLALAYAQFGTAVNAADGGGSLIVSREGGHQKSAPPVWRITCHTRRVSYAAPPPGKQSSTRPAGSARRTPRT